MKFTTEDKTHLNWLELHIDESIVNEQWLLEIVNEVLEVIKEGAKKHGSKNWMLQDGSKSSLKDMHASIFRHAAFSSSGIRMDTETHQDHLINLITRASMTRYRIKHNIVHKDDAK